jgi:hypothetical protein
MNRLRIRNHRSRTRNSAFSRSCLVVALGLLSTSIDVKHIPSISIVLAATVPKSEDGISVNSSLTDGDVVDATTSTLVNATRSLGFWDPEVEELRKQYWQRTFEDIRQMTSIPEISNTTNPFFSEWKLFTTPTRRKGILSSPSAAVDVPNETTSTTVVDSSESFASDLFMIPRFDGFPSWERMLADWSDEIQEYLEQVEEEQALGYSMSNYGRAPAPAPKKEEGTTSTATSRKTATREAAPLLVKAVSTVPLPIPAPARPGEEILVHTDISNKSKSILVVTTASLPWKTGTAVNPLLRAAYLTRGRKERGGNVTLMLPWLERKIDQISVYGPKNLFETPEDQEHYIRKWLNESAQLEPESVDLNIAWYTAWQNKVENSIYSMGDITATISTSIPDICILEEPEHLNWYRAPGESWTKKFPHVVGILHTNYFSYAMDQPAALIRVRCYFLEIADIVSTLSYFVLFCSRHPRCACCVLGCVGLIATASLNCPVLWIKWHRKRS